MASNLWCSVNQYKICYEFHGVANKLCWSCTLTLIMLNWFFRAIPCMLDCLGKLGDLGTQTILMGITYLDLSWYRHMTYQNVHKCIANIFSYVAMELLIFLVAMVTMELVNFFIITLCRLININFRLNFIEINHQMV